MEFKDRVANKPNRVKLTYEDSGASTFATVELADEPIEEGTPLNAENMNKLLNKEDYDYIVEQGTITENGNWNYRKWASGVAECFGYIPKQLTISDRFSQDNIYYTQNNVEIKIPNIFIEDYIFRDVQTSDESTWSGGFYFNRAESALYGKFFSYNEGTRNASVYIMVTGRWK